MSILKREESKEKKHFHFDDSPVKLRPQQRPPRAGQLFPRRYSVTSENIKQTININFLSVFNFPIRKRKKIMIDARVLIFFHATTLVWKK